MSTPEIIAAAEARGWRFEYDKSPNLDFPFTWFRPDGTVHDSYRSPSHLPIADIRAFTKGATVATKQDSDG